MKAELIMILAILAILSIIGWRVYDAGREAENAAQWRDNIASHTADEKSGWLIGMDLETGLNMYRAPARELDGKVAHATVNDTGNRFTTDSVQRTTKRIAAGEAARQRRQ